MNFIKWMVFLGLWLLAPLAHAGLKAFACEPEWAALLKELAGERVTVTVATTALQDPHAIQARPSLISGVRQAGLVICTGADLEVGWLPVLLERGANPQVQPGQPGYFEASSFVTMLDLPGSIDRSAGDVHPLGNPHVQTDPRNIARVARGLSQRLIQLDSANKADYQRRYEDFSARWQQALTRWQQQAAPLKGVVVVSQHKSWAYLLNWLGMREVVTLEPKPGIPPSAAHLATVLRTLEQQPARMILRAAYQDGRSSRWLNERTRIPIVTLPYTVGAEVGAADLFALYEQTLSRMLLVLKPKSGS